MYCVLLCVVSSQVSVYCVVCSVYCVLCILCIMCNGCFFDILCVLCSVYYVVCSVYLFSVYCVPLVCSVYSVITHYTVHLRHPLQMLKKLPYSHGRFSSKFSVVLCTACRVLCTV